MAPETVTLFEILVEIVARTGVSPDEIVGGTKLWACYQQGPTWVLSLCARKKWHDTGGFGKMTGKTHVAVLLAIDEAETERNIQQ